MHDKMRHDQYAAPYETGLVSIIVPVYNVEEYLDECMRSLVGQTYRNIEIMLVDDGSTDASGVMCDEWARRDSRVTCVHKENGGQATARNLGVELCHGEYIMFVDSDDWVTADFVEAMHDAIAKSGADIAECDTFDVANNGSIKKTISNNVLSGKRITKDERLIYKGQSFCKMIISKSFWNRNRLAMPVIFGEDTALYPLVIALSNKVASVDKALYFYRSSRPNNTTSHMENFWRYTECCHYIVESIKSHGLWEKQKENIFRFILRTWNIVLGIFMTRIRWDDSPEQKEKFYEILGRYGKFMQEHFPKKRVFRAACWGSYSVMRMVRESPALMECPFQRGSFMSLIDASGKAMEGEPPQHVNPYRACMLKRAWHKNYFSLFDEEKPDYFVLDLLEERHDFLMLEDSVLTMSDAMSESDIAVEGSVIPRDSDEAQEIWERGCLDFIERAKRIFDESHIILVENYLSECHGDIKAKEKFDEWKEIQRKNEILRKCYDFFKQKCPKAKVVNLATDDLFFSYDKFSFGCYPWHFNYLFYIKTGEKIAELIGGRE